MLPIVTILVFIMHLFIFLIRFFDVQ